MRTTQFPLNTVKETPADAEIASHQLMIRAGLIRKLAAGLYSWLPLGLRVLRKVEKITREEMEKAGALEVLMPALATCGTLAGNRTLGTIRAGTGPLERPS